MLQAGRRLSQADIDAVRRRYPALSVCVEDPVLDDVIEFEDDTRERTVAAEVQRRIRRSLAAVRDRFTRRGALRGDDFVALEAAVGELMEYLWANPPSAAIATDSMDCDDYFCTHTGNVFYLSMLLGGAVLDYVADERKRQTSIASLKTDSAMDLSPLALGALVMDLGLLSLQHLFQANAELSKDDAEALRRHPTIGVGMLPDSFSSFARVIVRTHHENFAGTGYPAGLRSNKIHVFARIVRIADAFDAATSTRFYRDARSPARVLWEMTSGPYRQSYDPRLIQAFGRLVRPFPIGSKLRLRDGRYAAVVKHNHADPFKPTVVVAFDAQNQPLPRSELAGPVLLSGHGELRIASFRGEDLSYLYTTGPLEPVPRRTEFTSALQAAYP